MRRRWRAILMMYMYIRNKTTLVTCVPVCNPPGEIAHLSRASEEYFYLFRFPQPTVYAHDKHVPNKQHTKIFTPQFICTQLIYSIRLTASPV